jgi:hypothetical protein
MADEMMQTVTDQFTEAKGYANTAFMDAQNFLIQIGNAIASLSIVVQQIQQNFANPAINKNYATTPTLDVPETQFADIPIETMPVLTPVIFDYVPQFPVNPGTFTGSPPTLNTKPPVNDFEFSESIYGSQLLTDLRAKLDWYIQNGGTGLGPAVEAAIWEDNQLRVQQEFERQYEQAESFWAARGFNMPPGMLQAALTEAVTEQTRKLTYTSNEIAIEQARIAKDQTKTMYELSGTLETATMNYFSQVAARSLEASKFSVDAAIQIFKAAVDYFTAQMQAYRVSAEVFATEVDAFKSEVQAETAKVEAYKVAADVVLAQNKEIIDVYVAEIDLYKAQIQYEMARVDSLIKVFSAQTNLYGEEVRLALGDVNTQVEVFKGQIQENQIQAQISMKQAELNLQAYLGKIDVAIKALSAGAEVSAHLASAALSSIHAQASMGEQVEYYDDITSTGPTPS